LASQSTHYTTYQYTWYHISQQNSWYHHKIKKQKYHTVGTAAKCNCKSDNADTMHNTLIIIQYTIHLLSCNTKYSCYNVTYINYITSLTYKKKFLLILHFKHLLNSLVCECYSYWGCCVHFDYNNYTVVLILFMINKNIYVNTTQFNVDICVIDIYYLFQNQKIKNTSI
jgi:hypothetical protein